MLHVRSPFRRQTPPPGARPGTLAIAEGAPAPRIRAVVYGPDHIEERDVEDVETLAALLEQQSPFWIDVTGTGDAQVLLRIQELFGIHRLAMADVVNVPQRPKVEDYGDRHLLVTRMARVVSEEEIDLEQVSLLLGPGFLISFQEREGDVFEPVRLRLRSGVGPLRRSGPDYLAYALIDAVIDGYFPVLEKLGEELERLEDEALERPRRETLARIQRVRRTLVALHRIHWRQRDALSSLVRDEASPFTPAVRVYLRDAYDHTVQILDLLESSREMVVGLMDLYLSALSHRMNDVMKTLTVMATIFIPLTFIAGVYGMNFDRMPELHWRWGYATVWGVMVGVAAALLVLFRRRGWLGDGDPER